MFKNHLRIFQKQLSRKKIPAAFISSKSDIFYLTGISLDGISLIVMPKDKAVFTSRMLKAQAGGYLPGWKVVAEKNIFSGIQQYLQSKRIRCMYADKDAVSYGLACLLKGMKKIKIIFSTSLCAEQRMIKSAPEIERIKNACSITARVFRSIPSYINKKMTEQDLANTIDRLFLETGSRNAFETIVSCGSKTAEPHHISGCRYIENPGPIMIDTGGVFKGYAADLTRTYYLGKMSKFYRQIHDLVCLAKAAAEHAVRPGVPAAEIDARVRKVFKQAGYEKYFIHSTGHGVGIDVHEPPLIGPESKVVLQPGMVITIEPGLYFSGKFGVRMEDTLLVTENGYEILTK